MTHHDVKIPYGIFYDLHERLTISPTEGINIAKMAYHPIPEDLVFVRQLNEQNFNSLKSYESLVLTTHRIPAN